MRTYMLIVSIITAIAVPLILPLVVFTPEQTLLASTSSSTFYQPPSESNEVKWSAYLAAEYGGEAEHRLPNGSRIDILTEDVAWEVEWVDKWEESIGQALFYGVASNRSPGVWLLLRGKSDEDYLQCLVVVDHLRQNGIDIHFKTIKTD